MTRRRSAWTRALLWTLGLALTAAAVLLASLAAGLSGGWDDLLDVSSPTAEDAEVVEARQRAEAQHAGAVGALAAAPAGSESTCVPGQHNWKIDDPYDLLCTETTTAVVAGGSTARFADDALALHARLLAAGWQPRADGAGLTERSSLAWVVQEYWLPAPGSPGELPAATYLRGDVELTVAPATGDRPLPWAWPAGTAAPPPGTWSALLLLRSEYFSA